MKNQFAKWCVAAICSVVLCCSCQARGSLTDVTKPYLGEYECIRVQFNEKDYLNQFEFIRLTLNPDASFVLSYCEKDKEKQEWAGEYTYDKASSELVLTIHSPVAYHRHVPIQNGKIIVSFPIGEKTFIAEFTQS